MEIVLAALALDGAGGMQTYLLTVAPHLERLGHEVTLYSPLLGPVADLARARGLRVHGSEHELPPACDAVLSSDAVSALTMADLYPAAVRGIVVHGGDFDLHLPPAHEAVVSFAVAMNGVVERRVEATAHAPRVARLTQPIDIAHFCPAVPVGEQVERVLLLGNYLRGRRRELLVRSCEQAGVAWRQVGQHGEIALDPFSAILQADVVVGQGRAALEGMACGRAVWVYGPSGADGWVTEDTYGALEDDGFRGRATNALIDPDAFGRALGEYRPRMGDANRELMLLHHSPYDHAVALVGLLDRARAAPPAPAPLREMARLVRTHHDAQARVDGVVSELRELHEHYQAVHGHYQAAQDRAALLEAEQQRLTTEIQRLTAELQLQSRKCEELVATTRWRAACLAARPLDRARTKLGIR